MPHDWNKEQVNDFCINTEECSIDPALQHMNCYNFNKGLRRLVYVRKDSITITSKSLSEKSQDIVDFD